MMRALLLLFIAALAGVGPALAERSAAAEGAPSAEPDRAARLRCAAAFMIIRDEQQRGVKPVVAYPAMEPRGRQYFEQVMADEARERNLDSAGSRALANAQVEQLQMGSIQASDPAKYVDGIMQPCLRLLDAKFPPR
jgi:hypothetical protein